MSVPCFDVLTERWIPVIRRDGLPDKLGIRRCLNESHELIAIRDPAPIVEFGLYRLLVAFVLDALVLAGRRPEHPLDLKGLIKDERFDGPMIEDYIKRCGDVFDLFHSERPFLQTKMDKVKPKPLAAMFPGAPSGTNVGHWHHMREDDMVASPDAAARLLTTIAPFMTAGGAGLSPSINGAPAVYAMLMGKSLFETLVLNLPLRNQDAGQGVIAWRSTRPPGRERSEATTVEALTWRPRRIQLVANVASDASVSVREMKFEKGDSTRLPWIDASLAYRYHNDKVTPIRMRVNRPLWRDAGALLLLNEGQHGRGDKKVSFCRPDVVQQAFDLAVAGEPLVIQVYGMRTDMKMKVFEWAKSRWSVPSILGRLSRLGRLVQNELDLAEQTAFELRTCIKALYPREGAGNKQALGALADRCERAYWQTLEAGFQPLMSAFGELDADAPDNPTVIVAAAKDWRAAIRKLAGEQFELAAEDMDADSDALERQVRARTRLHSRLKKVLS